jgi:hypothetical protein
VTDGDKEERLCLFELICQLGNEDEEAGGMERDARSATVEGRVAIKSAVQVSSSIAWRALIPVLREAIVSSSGEALLAGTSV